MPGGASRMAVLLLRDRTSWMLSRGRFCPAARLGLSAPCRSSSVIFRATEAPMLASMEGVPLLKAVAR